MRIENHRLLDDLSGTPVEYQQTPNYSAAPVTPRFLILHYTAGGAIDGTVNWFSNPRAKASAHLVIGRDGRIIQMGEFNQCLYHAGRSRYDGYTGLNRHSIGIEICNWGHLTGGPGAWRTTVGQHIPDDRVATATHKLDSKPVGWEIYDPAQYAATVAAAQAICSAYGIAEEYVLGHDDISGYRGKRDPGPLLDLQRFRGLVFGRGESLDEAVGAASLQTLPDYRITATSGLNMRTGPGLQYRCIKTLPRDTEAALLSTDGVWTLVAEINANGQEDTTGWVHSRWLEAV